MGALRGPSRRTECSLGLNKCLPEEVPEGGTGVGEMERRAMCEFREWGSCEGLKKGLCV